jgi:hypothetical protein
MMNELPISIPQAELAAFCRLNHIKRLSLFGSVLRDDFTPTSDVDVLVEFEAGTRIGLIGFERLRRELSEMLGRRVDLNTAQCLSRYFRDEVVREARALHVAA